MFFAIGPVARSDAATLSIPGLPVAMANAPRLTDRTTWVAPAQSPVSMARAAERREVASCPTTTHATSTVSLRSTARFRSEPAKGNVLRSCSWSSMRIAARAGETPP